MTLFTSYFASHKGDSADATKNMLLLSKAFSKYGDFETVFRYPFPFLKGKEFEKEKTYFLYENLPDLTDAEVAEIERKYLLPYSIIRLMACVSRIRYPDLSNLPSDLELARIAAAWVEYFKEKKPDVFIGGLIDDFSGIIAMEVAKRMGIKVATIFSGGVFSGQYMICDEDFLPAFFKELGAKEIEEGARKAKQGLLGEKMLNASVGKYNQPWFDFTALGSIFRLGNAFAKSIMRYYYQLPAIERKMWLSPFDLAARQSKYFIRSRVSSFFFNQKPKEGDRFVFFPLHFADDAALVAVLPLADQIQMVEELSKVMPHGVKLYIKPHPHWKCADMKIGDMARLKRLPNVVPIHYDVGAKDLIKNSEYVVIINSTVGYECLAMGKRVYSLGNFYPPDIIPRLGQPRDIIEASKQDLDWKKADDFLGKVYLHGIKCPDELFSFGAVNEEIAGRLAEAINEYRIHFRKAGK